MTKVLLLESEHEGFLKNGKLKNGLLEVDDKVFYVDDAVPINIKGKFGKYEPLFIVKWNSLVPSTDIHDVIGFHRSAKAGNPSSKKEEFIKPKFDENPPFTPEMAKKLVGMKILGNMIRVKSSGGFGGSRFLIYLIAGVGAAIVFLYMNGYISF